MGAEGSSVQEAAARAFELLRAMPIAAAVFRLEGDGTLGFVWANGAAVGFVGQGVAPLPGQPLDALFPGADVAQCVDVARSGEPRVFEQAIRGKLAAAQVSITVFPLPDRCVGIVVQNVTRSRHAERILVEANTFLDSVVENIPDMVFIKDAEHLRFERFNRAGEELLGVPRRELLGKSDHDFFPKDQAEFFQARDREVLETKTLLDIPEEPIQTAHGQRWLHTKKIPLCDENGEPRYLLGISEDITERKKTREELTRAKVELEQRVLERTADLQRANAELLREALSRRQAEHALEETEEQLRHAQKMEAVGRLAGGMAHDFNNLLSVVLSYSELLLTDLRGDERKRADVDEIRRAAIRGGELTRQLLAFGRRQVLQPRVLDLNDVLRAMDRMLRRLLGEDVELTLSAAPGLAAVHVDPGQMEQVLLNLVVNARDAMPHGGKLSLATANVVLEGDHVDLPPGSYVVMSVTDTGTGMAKDTLLRIYEPFFTTKEKGKGTGLGLSTVFGIVKQSGGGIRVESEPGRGTTFRVYLPRTSRPPVTVVPRPPSALPARGAETILIVEDEPQMRVVARTILQRNGYTVLDASDAAEALALARAFAGPIELLLTDVVMPRMSGRELASRLAALRPAIRVLYMSGYTDNTVAHHGVLDEGIAFVQKPFTPDTLTEKVREVLLAYELPVGTAAPERT